MKNEAECCIGIAIIAILAGIYYFATTYPLVFIGGGIVILILVIAFYLQWKREEEERVEREIGLTRKDIEREQKEEEKRVEREQKEEERREREWREEKERLEIEISRLERPYIKLFVERYSTEDLKEKTVITPDYSMDREAKIYGEKRELLTLLEAKGVKMNREHLNYFIKKEVERKEEEDFIRKVSYGNPKTIEDYCSNFLDVFGDRYTHKDLSRLEQYLTTKGLYSEGVGSEQLRIRLEGMQKEKKIRMLEKKFSERDGEYFSIQRIDTMGGFEFEGLVARLYKSMGYDVRITPQTGDQGADLVIEKFGEKTAVQIKRSSTNVGNKAVQEIVAARNFYKCDKAIVVTNSFFTRSAEELAGSNNVKLVNRTEFEELIQKYL